MTRRGVYPGSFNPATVAHLAIAEAVVAQRNLDQLVFVLSEVALAKEHQDAVSPSARAAWLNGKTANFGWASVIVVDAKLIADIANGYDVVVMGADKWAQVNDPVFYDSAVDRDAALARLPELAIAPRDGVAIPASAVLDLPDWIQDVSSTAVRDGNHRWRA